MDSFVIPSPPNWYEPDVMACAPDNTVMYGSRNDLIIIKPIDTYYQPNDIQVIPDAHFKSITVVNFNKNWGSPYKYAVTASTDRVIKLWDVETLRRKMSHNKHCSEEVVKVIGVSFAGDNRIVSATSEGQVIIWNLVNNEHTILDSIFKTVKGTLTAFSICPHEASRAAFGLKNGLVIIVDLRGSGKILATYRGHKSEVTSMSWCPVPVNIFPKNPNNTVAEKKYETLESHTTLDDTKATANFTTGSLSAETNGTKETPQISNTERDKAEVVNLKQPESTEKFSKEDCPDSELSVAVTSKIDGSAAPDNLDPTKTQDPNPTNPDIPLPLDVSCISDKVEAKPKCEQSLQLGSGDNEPTVPVENTSFKEYSSNVTKVLDSETESNKNTPTDRRNISMELSYSTEHQPNIIVLDSETESNKNTPTDRRNIPMELSYSTEHQPNIITLDVIKPETESNPEERENKTEVNTSVSTGQQKSSVENITIEQIITKYDSSPDENWRSEAVLRKIEEQPRREFLLATSARDGYVYIWQTLGGPLATFFTIPLLCKNKSKKSKTLPKDVFNVLCWATPRTLLSSTIGGELLGWTLPKPGGLNKAYIKIHNYHGKPITCIKTAIAYDLDETNFLQEKNITVWTTGLDRVLCSYDCDSDKLITYYQSLNGSACCLAGCPLDPSRLAMGDEKNIKIWNLSQTNNKIFRFPTSFEKIHSVITAMAWHPTDENTLAFGTQEGRIGIVTISGKNIKTKVLPQYFKSEIYKMEWGPGRKLGSRKLFALSAGVVVSFDTDSDEEPVALVVPSPQVCRVTINTLYTFAWSPDYSFLFASSKDRGCIKYDKNLETYEVFYMCPRIDSVVWHPDAYARQPNGTETHYSTVFASVVMGSGVMLFYYTTKNGKTTFLRNGMITYKSSKARIRAIQWSPFAESNLVWVNDLGVAVVADTTTQRILHTYINPWLDGLASVYWSSIHPSYIILTTDNRMVLSVNITDYPGLNQAEIDSTINRINKKRGTELTHNLPKAKEEIKEKEGGKGKNKKCPLIVPVFYTIKEKNQVSDLRKVLQWKLEGNIADENSSSCQIGVLDVFGDDCNLEKIFKSNISSLTQNNHTDKLNMMALMKGDINETVKNAIEQKRVNTWIISVAPMVSPQCWKDACKTYVEQLLEQSDPDVFEVVTFQLVCHQVEEAVKFLCERKLFREAYVLAKKRLGSGNEIINTVLSEWAKHCAYEGNYEFASCCYITLGMYSEAAYLLFRRTSVELLEFAAHLAKLAGNDDLQKAIEDKVEALRKPVDLTGSSLPYLDNKGEKLRIFTAKTPDSSDLSETADSDNEVTAEPKQELVKQATEKPDEEEAQTEQSIEQNTDQRTTLIAEERENLDGSEPESFASAVDAEYEYLEDVADVTFEIVDFEDISDKASPLSDEANEPEDWQAASKRVDNPITEAE